MSCISGLCGVAHWSSKSKLFLSLKNDISELILIHGIYSAIFHVIKKNKYILLFEIILCVLSVLIISRMTISGTYLSIFQKSNMIVFVLVINSILLYSGNVFSPFIIFYAMGTVYIFSFAVYLSVENAVSVFSLSLSLSLQDYRMGKSLNV